jgi:hypothetical protein
LILGTFLFSSKQNLVMANQSKVSFLGLKIVTPEGFKSKSVEELGSMEFVVKVDYGSFADPLFYSSPRLRAVIEKYPKLIGDKIGTMEYSGFSFSKKSPVLHVLNYPFLYLKKELLDFKGKGFALELERKVISAIKQRFGNVIIKPLALVSLERRKRLISRGIKAGAVSGYSQSATGMLSKINATRRANRKRFRLKK